MAVLMKENLVYITNPTTGSILKHSIPPMVKIANGRRTKRSAEPQNSDMQSVQVSCSTTLVSDMEQNLIYHLPDLGSIPSAGKVLVE